MKFLQENDVVIYGEKTVDVPSDGIVLKHDENGVCVKAFRHWTGPWDGEWNENGESGGRISDHNTPRLHPDADRVWAEYCAYQLTKGVQ